jgi:hypothetical protein
LGRRSASAGAAGCLDARAGAGAELGAEIEARRRDLTKACNDDRASCNHDGHHSGGQRASAWSVLMSAVGKRAIQSFTTLKMFYYLSKLPYNLYDFVLWMDDDVFVCKNFIKNADIWIKNYANFSIYSSLYVPYRSFPIKNKTDIKLSNIHEFYGTCAVIFKPLLAKYVIPHWYDRHFQQFSYNPDTRFRDSVRKQFPDIKKICVSEPSIVQHMNIGSAIKEIKSVSSTNKGHICNNFIGEDNDPNFIF